MSRPTKLQQRKKKPKYPESSVKCEFYDKRTEGVFGPKGHSKYYVIVCRGYGCGIGFSTNPSAVMLSDKTFNAHVTKDDPKRLRESYIKSFCRGEPRACKIYIKAKAKQQRKLLEKQEFIDSIKNNGK